MNAGQQLIDRIVALLRRYVVLTEGQALTVALWALSTWVYERFSVTPYLEIWAEHKRSGKSTLAELLSLLCRGGRILATVRTLQMVRLIEALQGHYVPFIEEAERFHKGALSDDRSILATGYRKGAAHELSNSKGELLRFRTFCPKAFVLIGNVHEIIRDRCISVKLERGTPVADWTLERFAAEAEIAGIIDAWRAVARDLDVTKDGGDVRFKLIDPAWLTSARDREIWTPLFTLAHALRLHKGTIDLLIRASVDMSVLKTLPTQRYHPSQEEKLGDDQNASQALLLDCQRVIGDETNISTEELLKRLQGIDAAPWRSWRGTGLDENALATLLARYGIGPKVVRIGKGRKGSTTARGYVCRMLRAAKP